MNKSCIIVSGLPGSGKTTIGKKLHDELTLPILDKDLFLEELFEEKGIGDINWRNSLSREADCKFIRAAKESGNVILVSHWRPINIKVDFGTPTEWIAKYFENVIELNIVCTVEIAAERFKNRIRHSGHQDNLKSLSQTITMLNSYQQYLPVGIGKLVQINTNGNWDNSFKEIVNTITQCITS